MLPTELPREICGVGFKRMNEGVCLTWDMSNSKRTLPHVQILLRIWNGILTFTLQCYI